MICKAERYFVIFIHIDMLLKKKNLGKFDEVFTSGKIKCHKTLDVYIYMVIICSGI